jgi:hypothetical protein
MQPSHESKLASVQSLASGAPQNRKREDLPYQAVTVAAILLVLITLWVF